MLFNHESELHLGGPGGSSDQRPTGPEGGGDGQEGPEDEDRSSPNGDDPPRNGDGPPPRDSDRSPRGDGDGDGDGPQTRSDEDPPSRSGEGFPSRSSNGSRSSGDDDCFRARMTRPVVWFPDYVGAGDDEGNELADDSICPPINFRVSKFRECPGGNSLYVTIIYIGKYIYIYSQLFPLLSGPGVYCRGGC